MVQLRSDARVPSLATVPLAVMLANAGAPAGLGLAPLAVMLADAVALAVLADAPAALMFMTPAANFFLFICQSADTAAPAIGWGAEYALVGCRL